MKFLLEVSCDVFLHIILRYPSPANDKSLKTQYYTLGSIFKINQSANT